MSEEEKKYQLFKIFSFEKSHQKIILPQEISEQKHVEETYRMLEKAVEQSMDGIAVASMNGVVRFCNEAWAKMHGYCISEIIGKHLKIFHTEQQMIDDVIPFNEQVKKNGFHSGEVGHKRKDGSIFSAWMTTNVLTDEKGKTVGLVGIARDITEQKKIETALRDSEAQYRITINSMKDAIHVVDKELKIVIFNTAFKNWCKKLGLDGHAEKRYLFDVFPFLKKEISHEYKIVFETGQIVKTEEKTMISDNEIVTETLKIPIFRGKEVVQVVTVVKDVTDYRQAEETIRKLEQEKKIVFDTMSELVVYHDKDMKILFANKAAGNSVGKTPNELKGHHCYEIWHNRSKTCIGCPIEKTLKTSQINAAKISTPDGRFWWIKGYPVRDERGEVIGAVEVANDITISEKADAELRRSEEKYRFLFEKSPIFSIIIGDDQTIKDINNNSLERLGYLRPEVIDKNTTEFIVPEDRNKTSDILKRAFRGEETESIEVNIYAKDKSVHTILFIPGKQVILSDKGNPSQLLFTGIDISERKKAEKQQLAMTAGLRAVIEAADQFIACPDVETVFRRAVEFARDKFGLERCAIFIEDNGYVRGIYGTDRHGRTTDERDLRFEKNEAWKKRLKMLDPRDPNWVVVREPQLEWNGKNTIQIGEGWIVITPIQSASRSIGVFVNDAAISGSALDPMKQDALSVFCSLIGNIIERKRAENKLEVVNKRLMQTSKRFKQLALRDSHTGLYNHRYLVETIEAEFNRAKRYGYALSIIMFDLDYFKSINDVYGHQFGDLVLKQFSRKLKKTVRQYDIVIRFGGEEFVVISPGIDRSTALILSQRILDNIYLSSFGNDSHSIKLKLSAAVASYPEDDVAMGMDLINLVDKILNRVKEDGGDRVYSILDAKKKQIDKIEKTENFANVKFLQEKLEKLTKRANQSLIESIFAFAKTIKLRDQYTGDHVENTVQFATELAKRLCLPERKIEQIKQAAQLHDLGKIGISDRILLKKSKLTKSEFEEIKKHPLIGADILRSIQFLHDIVPLILYHHERWDGKGYPYGLRKDQIPMGARIVAIADTYQALISDRPYRPAFSKTQAIKLIKAGSGTQFDPAIVETFLGIV